MELQYHVYVPEVVREPRMHFYRVPRLGAFLAVPLEYNSSLSQRALDQSIVDYQQYVKNVEELEKAKKEWDDESEKIREEKEKLGEPYEYEPRTWPVIKEKPFLTKQRRYVVCLDTMGQDREFTDQERRFALETVTAFASIWEKREEENLTKDRNARLHLQELDKEFAEGLAARLQEEEDDFVKEHIHMLLNPATSGVVASEEAPAGDLPKSRAATPASQVGKHPYARMDDEQKDMYQRALRLRHQAQQSKQVSVFKQGFQLFSEFTVIKYPRVWQSLFYLLGYEREAICERHTNKLHWKIAKKHFAGGASAFLEKLAEYEAQGAKPEERAAYTTLNFLEKNVENYYPEDVDAYSASMVGRLLRWLLAAVKLRRQDVIRRKAL